MTEKQRHAHLCDKENANQKILGFYLTLIRMTKHNKSMTAHDDRDVEQREYFPIGGWNANFCHHSGNQFGRFSEN